jgi:hypothetical protein
LIKKPIVISGDDKNVGKEQSLTEEKEKDTSIEKTKRSSEKDEIVKPKFEKCDKDLIAPIEILFKKELDIDEKERKVRKMSSEPQSEEKRFDKK